VVIIEATGKVISGSSSGLRRSSDTMPKIAMAINIIEKPDIARDVPQ